jgi:hypothetical protein
MNKMLVLIIILLGASPIMAEETIPVPWKEFKNLYKESIERKINTELKAVPHKRKPLVYSLDRADYKIQIKKGRAEGQVIIQGKIIAGDPCPIQLFGKDLLISSVEKIKGGILLPSEQIDSGIDFLPSKTAKDFMISINFLIPVQEDNKSRLLSFFCPKTLANTLTCELDKNKYIILKNPGILSSDGKYHFSAAEPLEIRYQEKKDIPANQHVEVDLISQIKLHGQKVFITTTFLPRSPIPKILVLYLPEETDLISSSLKNSWIKNKGKNIYQISIPSDYMDNFKIQFCKNEEKTKNIFSFTLPSIKKNNGDESGFIIHEPENGQLILSGSGLENRPSITALSSVLRNFIKKEQFFKRIPKGNKLSITFKNYHKVSSPRIILPSLSLYTSYEENGGVLSVLTMNVPPEVGTRLSLKAEPGTRIWSLRVNSQQKKLYTDQKGQWVIPLDRGIISHVELAFIRQGKKLGLKGRLEAILPAIGLQARNVQVGIALPQRVQLLSLEGPVHPIKDHSGIKPVEFIGKPYFFNRSFYQGKEIKLSILYKEPVKGSCQSGKIDDNRQRQKHTARGEV